MARIRSVKPEMRKSLTVCGWPLPVRYTLVGLLGYADDFGRGLFDLRLIKAELYPVDDPMTPAKIGQHIKMIQDSGVVCCYNLNGRNYFHLPTWNEHQRVSHPSPSRIPPCPTHEEGAFLL